MAEAFAASKGRYGYRRIKAMLRTGVSEKVIRRIMAEDGLTAHVPERRGYGSYGGETTPAPGNLVTRDFTAKLPNEKWLTDITRDQGPGREDVPLRRRSTATMARSSRMRPVPVPVDDCIRWHDHERIKRSLGWMGPVQYRQSQGMAA